MRSTAPAGSGSARACSATESPRRRRCSRRAHRCSCRCSWPAGSTRCRCSRRSATRCTASTARCSAIPESQGVPFREDPTLHWHPSATSFAQLHDAGKVTVFPGIGYSDPDMSHFTSRHYWEVGATDTALNTGWLGRYLDVHGASTQPAPGPVDGRRDEPDARDRGQPGGGDRPAGRLLAVPERGLGEHLQLHARLGVEARRPPAALGRPGDRAGRRGRVRGRRTCATRWRRSGQRAAAPRTRAPSPTRRRAPATSRSGSPGSRR